MKDIVIFYHAECPDGFGAAYAAWKKFGNKASYVPLRHSDSPPSELKGKEVYFADFCYRPPIMREIESTAKKLVVLDHHLGAKEWVEGVQEYVFDAQRSGASIAWGYFHPHTPLPRLLSYVEDVDLGKCMLPYSKELSVYLGTIPLDFARWDILAADFEDDTKFKQLYDVAKPYAEYFDFLSHNFVKEAEEVEMDGYRVLAVNAPKFFSSSVGNYLAKKHPPFSVVWYWKDGFWNFSLRGTGEVNLAELAKQHGGGGHPNAAGFHISDGAPFPFKRV